MKTFMHMALMLAVVFTLGLALMGMDGCNGDDDDDDDDDNDSDEESFVCDPRPPVELGEMFFSDVSAESGMQEDNFYEDPPEGFVYNAHPRTQAADLNGDGYDDLIMHTFGSNPNAGYPYENLIFFNNGDGTFTQVSEESGLKDAQAEFFAFGDVDNDGDQDVFSGLPLFRYEDYRNEIYINDGTGVFKKKNDAGVNDTYWTRAGNALFADFDGDANLDLFIGNGATSSALEDFLYLGNGDGTFEDASDRLHNAPSQPSNGSVVCDFDNDGDLDIFVSTYSVSRDNGLNHLWQNDGSANFIEVAVEKGFAHQATGNYWLESTGYGTDEEPGAGPGTYVGSNGFGIDCGDVDNDGDIDVFLTTISHAVDSDYLRKWSDPSQLLINQGEDEDYVFVNEYLDRNIPFNEGDLDGAMIDFDNDGLMDLSMGRERKYESGFHEFDQKGWFGLMHQLADGTFESLGQVCGINDEEDKDYYRAKLAGNNIWLDYDKDGDLDLLIGMGDFLGKGRANFLLRNDIGQDNRWLAVRLEGDGENINRDAIGARLYLESDDFTVMREHKSSKGSFNSEQTRVEHFGLGDMGCEYKLRVVWPDGEEAEFVGGEDFGDDIYVKITYPDQIETEE
jgi:enediyne biosynthesis protein E4